MATEQDFLAALEAAPDDDVTRLVYADWLEDQGQSARAEFIRVQCELAKLPEGHPRQRKLVLRERRLLAQHRMEWVRPVADLAPKRTLIAMSGYARDRKMPTNVGIEGYLNQWGVLFRGGVIDELIVPAGRLPAEAGKLEQLPTLRALDIRNICGNVRLAEELAALPLLGKLEGLRLADSQSFYFWAATSLAGLPGGGGYSNDVEPRREALRQVVQSPHLKRLRTLGLADNWIQEGLGQTLANAKQLRGLSSLDLSGNRVTSEDLRWLAEAEHLAGLQRLNLRNTHLGDGVRVLREARVFPNLAELDLSQSRLLLAGIQELFRIVPLEKLKVLKLNRLNQQIGMVQALVNCSRLRNLEQLELSWNRIGEQGARLLAGCPHLSNLKVLRLRRTRITLAAAEALATSPHLKKLEVLEIGSNLRKAEQKELRSRSDKDFWVF
jgi:uncharacterized protein (TIGR02996 family)